MALPVFFTTDPSGRSRTPPGQDGVSAVWLQSTFDKSLFVSQDDRKFLFVRARTRANGAPVVVLAGATDATAEASAVEAPVAALRDTSVFPHIAKVFLSLFNTSISLADEEVTATRARTGDATVQKVVVARLKSDGVTVTRGQSTLNVASFLSLVAPRLSGVELVLLTERGGGAAPQGEGELRQEPPAEGRVPCAPLKKLTTMGAIVGALSTDEPSLTWEDAEAFFTAALGKEVKGRMAVLSAGTKLESKLVVSSKTKAALKTALDIARAAGVELSMAERGELLAAQGIPSITPSPVAPRPAAKRKERAPQQQPAQRADDDSGDGEEDDDEGSGGSDSYGSDEEDEVEELAPPTTAQPAPRAAAPEPAAGAPGAGDEGSNRRPRKKKKSARRQGAALSPETAADLARLTPAGWKATQVARVLFDEPLLSEKAKYAERQQRDSDSDADELTQQRVALAVRRLKEVSGVNWIPKEQVTTKTALKQVREQVFHLVARGPENRAGAGSAAPCPHGTHVRTAEPPTRVLVDVDAPEPVVTLSTGAPELAAEHQASAVLPDVVERLHAGSGLLAYSAGGDVGAGICSAPEHLRLDLARAVGSNGRVDATGERSLSRNTMPSVVVRMHRALVNEVKDALQQLPGEDQSGFQHLYDKPARKLAEAAVCGLFTVQDYVKEAAQVLGTKKAPTPGFER